MRIFVARQPIFDRGNRVAGYELLYTRDQISTAASGLRQAEMSSQVLVNTFLGIGLHRLTHGRPAFLNCTRDLLLGPSLELLDPNRVVLEILENVEPDDEVVAACSRLASSGFRIALDDFTYSEHFDPLLEIVHIVKIDVLAYTIDELEDLVRQLRSTPVRLLAEKVETRKLHELCMDLGFEYFQGYFYSRPETLARTDLSVRQLGLLRILNLLRDLDTPASELEEAFRSDLSLSYKLLRIANSAAFGISGIASIGHAIQLLGREPLYRWLALLLVGSAGRDGGLDLELVKTALIRARFSELLAHSVGGGGSADSLFLVGLFSLLDAILSLPMSEALSQLALSAPVVDALLRREGPLAPILEVVEAYETGNWDRVHSISNELDIDEEDLPDLYLKALTWTRTRLADPYL